MIKDSTQGGICNFPYLLLHVDGGCEPKNPGGIATSGWVLYEQDGGKPLVEQGAVVAEGGPLATNNYGEYRSLILALDFLLSAKWRGSLMVKADSKLLVEQVCGRWKVKAEHLKPLRAEIWKQLEELDLHVVTESDPLPSNGKKLCEIQWVARDFNQYANDLCRRAYSDYIQTV